LSFDEPLSVTKQIHSLTNPENENTSKSANILNSEFTKKLKLNPNAKPIHFSSKRKSDTNSQNILESKPIMTSGN
jgi:hypothetical protein